MIISPPSLRDDAEYDPLLLLRKPMSLTPVEEAVIDARSGNAFTNSFTGALRGNEANRRLSEEASLRAAGDLRSVAEADALRPAIESFQQQRQAYSTAPQRYEDVVEDPSRAGSYLAGQLGNTFGSFVEQGALSLGANVLASGLQATKNPILRGAGTALRYLTPVELYRQNYELQKGEGYGSMREDPTIMATRTPQEINEAAQIHGARGAVLDTILPAAFGNALTGGALKAATKKMGAGATFGANTLVEGGTEGLQQVSQHYALEGLNPNRDTSGDTSENINSVIGGMVGGAGVGGIQYGASKLMDGAAKGVKAPGKRGDDTSLDDDKETDVRKIITAASADPVKNPQAQMERYKRMSGAGYEGDPADFDAADDYVMHESERRKQVLVEELQAIGTPAALKLIPEVQAVDSAPYAETSQDPRYDKAWNFIGQTTGKYGTESIAKMAKAASEAKGKLNQEEWEGPSSHIIPGPQPGSSPSAAGYPAVRGWPDGGEMHGMLRRQSTVKKTPDDEPKTITGETTFTTPEAAPHDYPRAPVRGADPAGTKANPDVKWTEDTPMLARYKTVAQETVNMLHHAFTRASAHTGHTINEHSNALTESFGNEITAMMSPGVTAMLSKKSPAKPVNAPNTAMGNAMGEAFADNLAEPELSEYDEAVARASHVGRVLGSMLGKDTNGFLDAIERSSKDARTAPLFQHMAATATEFAADPKARFNTERESRSEAVLKVVEMIPPEARAELLSRGINILSDEAAQEAFATAVEDHAAGVSPTGRSASLLKMVGEKSLAVMSKVMAPGRVQPLFGDGRAMFREGAERELHNIQEAKSSKTSDDRVESEASKDEDGEVTAWEKRQLEKDMEKLPPTSMVMHYGTGVGTTRAVKDAFTKHAAKDKDGNTVMRLPRLAVVGEQRELRDAKGVVLLDEKGEKRYNKVNAMGKMLADAHRTLRGSEKWSAGRDFNIRAMSALELMNREGIKGKKREDLMFDYMEQENEKITSDDARADAKNYRYMSVLKEKIDAVVSKRGKMTISEAAELNRTSLKIDTLKDLILPADVDEMVEVMSTKPKTEAEVANRYIAMAGIITRAHAAWQQQYNDNDLSAVVDKYFENRLLAVADQPTNASEQRLGLNVFRDMVEEGAKRASEARHSGTVSAEAKNEHFASLGLIQFKSPYARPDAKTKEVAIQAKTLVKWVREMKLLHTKDLRSESEQRKAEDRRKTPEGRAEMFRNDLNDGITTLATGGFMTKDTLPWITNADGKIEAFEKNSKNLPPSIDLDGLTQAELKPRLAARAVKDKLDADRAALRKAKERGKEQSEEADRDDQENHEVGSARDMDEGDTTIEELDEDTSDMSTEEFIEWTRQRSLARSAEAQLARERLDAPRQDKTTHDMVAIEQTEDHDQQSTKAVDREILKEETNERKWDEEIQAAKNYNSIIDAANDKLPISLTMENAQGMAPTIAAKLWNQIRGGSKAVAEEAQQRVWRIGREMRREPQYAFVIAALITPQRIDALTFMDKGHGEVVIPPEPTKPAEGAHLAEVNRYKAALQRYNHAVELAEARSKAMDVSAATLGNYMRLRSEAAMTLAQMDLSPAKLAKVVNLMSGKTDAAKQAELDANKPTDPDQLAAWNRSKVNALSGRVEDVPPAKHFEWLYALGQRYVGPSVVPEGKVPRTRAQRLRAEKANLSKYPMNDGAGLGKNTTVDKSRELAAIDAATKEVARLEAQAQKLLRSLPKDGPLRIDMTPEQRTNEDQVRAEVRRLEAEANRLTTRLTGTTGEIVTVAKATKAMEKTSVKQARMPGQQKDTTPYDPAKPAPQVATNVKTTTIPEKSEVRQLTGNQREALREEVALTDVPRTTGKAVSERQAAQSAQMDGAKVDLPEGVSSKTHARTGVSLADAIAEGKEVSGRVTALAKRIGKGLKNKVAIPAVNIFHGTGENAELSNLAARPFTVGGREYVSVEHAYQSNKTGYFDPAQYAMYTKAEVKHPNDAVPKTANGWNIRLMKRLMELSFEQNPEAAEQLAATGKSPLTHTQGKGVWKHAFPRLLTEIRDGTSDAIPTFAMKYADGQEFRGTALRMRPEFKGKDTMDLILSGDRTATTGSLGRFKGAKKGTVVMATGNGKKALIRFTSDPYPVAKMDAQEWSRLEGWAPEALENYRGEYQATYELVNVPVQGESATPVFDTLPSFKPGQKTMVYAGVGSRETPPEVLALMKKVASRLEDLGYTLQSGHADGADKAFEAGVAQPARKRIFLAKQVDARTRAIALEIHPEPEKIAHAPDLHARNTFQVFGANLDSPVDFVLAWTPDGAQSTAERGRDTGGTGQAIDMASRKGIPVINMAREGWQQRVKEILAAKTEEPVAALRTEGVEEAGNLYRNALIAIGGYNDKIAKIKDERGISQRFVREEDMLAEHAKTKGMSTAERMAYQAKDKADRIASLEAERAEEQSFVDALIQEFGKEALAASRTKITEAKTGKSGAGLAGREVNIGTVGRDVIAKIDAMTSDAQLKRFADAQRTRGEALGDSKLGRTMVAEAIYAENKLRGSGQKFNNEEDASVIDSVVGKRQRLQDRAARNNAPAKMQTVQEKLDQQDAARALAVSSAKAHFLKTLGASIKSMFADEFKGYKGRWDPVAQSIEIATANPLKILQLAYHESMHGFYTNILAGMPEVKEMLQTALSSPRIVSRLEAYLKGSPKALKAIKNDPEELVAYAYQFWAAGLLDVGHKPEGFFQQVTAFLRRVFGAVRDEDRALAIFTAFTNGSLVELSPAGKAISEIMQSGKWREQFVQRFDKQTEFVKTMILPAIDTFEDSESKTASEILTTMWWRNPANASQADEDGKGGVLDETRRKHNQYATHLSNILMKLDKRGVQELSDALNNRQVPVVESVRVAYDQVHALTKSFHAYLKGAGVVMGKRDAGQFMPVVWSVEYLIENRDKFTNMLKEYYMNELTAAKHDVLKDDPTATITEDDVALAMHLALVEQGGIGDKGLAPMREDGVLSPYFASKEKRSFDWIRPEHRGEFLSKDLVATLTRYFSQGTRTAEYVRVFGEDGQKLKDMMAREGETQMYDEASKRSIRYTADGPIVSELKAAATKLKLTGVKHEEWVDRRVEDLRRASGALEGVLGKDISKNFRQANAIIGAYQGVRLLLLSIFAAMLDPNGIRVVGGEWKDMTDAYLRGLTDVAKTWKDLALGNQIGARENDELAKNAAIAGTIDSNMALEGMGDVHTSEYTSGATRKVNRALFLFNGLTAWDRAMRISATNAAMKFIVRHDANADTQHSARWMKGLGLKQGEVTIVDGRLIIDRSELIKLRMKANNSTHLMEVAKAEADIKKVHIALNRWVNRAVITPNAAQRPTWGSDPHYQMLMHLKQFTYAFQKTQLKYAMDEWDAGNRGAAGRMLLGVPIMIAADMTKAVITGGGSLPGYMANWTMADWIMHGWSRSGINGIGQFGLDAIDHPSSVLGPMAGQVASAFGDDSAVKTVLKAIPGVSPFASQLSRAAGH